MRCVVARTIFSWRQHDGGHEDRSNMSFFLGWADHQFKYHAPARAADQPVMRSDRNSHLGHAQLLEKAKAGGISDIGTVDERNPVADDCGFAVLADALAIGADVFGAGFAPPHAAIGKNNNVHTAINRGIGFPNATLCA